MATTISQTELEELLKNLARGQIVNLGVGDSATRGWFRAQVVSHDAATGHLVVSYVMDRVSDRALEPGERIIVSATRADDEAQSAPMTVEQRSDGREPTVHLRMAGVWQAGDDRRHQTRVPLQIRATRARRWAGGAWRDLDATVVDLSSRGVGLILNQKVQISERLSLSIPLEADGPDLRVTLELRHVQADQRAEDIWRAGGLFRNLLPADHERVIRFIFAELRSRHQPAC